MITLRHHYKPLLLPFYAQNPQPKTPLKPYFPSSSSFIPPLLSTNPTSLLPIRALDAAQPYDYESHLYERFSSSTKLKIAIIGFGNFGQFLAKTMVQRGHTLLAHSRSDYSAAARQLGVSFFLDPNDLCEQHPDVIILSTSITSTESVLRALPIQRLRRNTLFVDVLSVKVFPKKLLLRLLPPEFDILCTHPMFGPESGKYGWKGLTFVYEKVRIGEEAGRSDRCDRFLGIFAQEGCEMKEMSCEEHDELAAESQFITHTMGRTLGRLNLQSTPINTKGYESLLELVKNTAGDSYDLYYGLFLYNPNAMEQLERFEMAFDSVKRIKEKTTQPLVMVSEKKIVEEVSGWLRVFDDGSVDRSWTGPKEAEFLTTPVAPSEQFIDGVATRDVVIDPKSGLSVRIYLPEEEHDKDAKLPILLHFHGGGFCISRASWYMYYHFYARLVKSAKAICVSVDMRLAPDHRLPAAVDDCYDALVWLRTLARGDLTEPWLSAYADFSRVFLIGDSSGGNLVHEVAARAGSQEWAPLQLAGGVPIHPGFVRSERSQSELKTEFETPFLTLKMVDTFLGLGLPIGSTKDHPITCPMGPAAPPLSKLKLPPFLMVVAERDLIQDTELEYLEEMKKAGKEIEVAYNKGVGHSFYLNKIAIELDPVTATETDLLISTISDFVKSH